MIIIGAGYSGLLAGCINKDAIIYEASTEEECAEKHQAVFRMRSNKIAEHLGINFKKVKVHKSICYCMNDVQPTPRMIHMYSQKVSGIISSRSIGNIATETRYIPPDNFYNILLRRSCDVAFKSKFSFDDHIKETYCVKTQSHKPEDSLINTIPLISVLRSKWIQGTKFGSVSFGYKPVYVTRFRIKNCDSHATIYYPHPDLSVYRATLNGDILIVESIAPLDESDDDFCEVFASLNIDEEGGIEKELVINAVNDFGKITEIDNKIRSKLILDLTLNHHIYSLGRYATWRPKIMLDDVFDDIFVIRRLIEDGGYSSVLYQQDKEE